MLKVRVIIYTLLVLLLLTLTLVFSVELVKAINVAVQWGRLLWDEGDTLWCPVERSYEADCCQSITNRYNLAGGWTGWNAYWHYTTQNNLINTLVWRQQNDVWATDFWVGDFRPILEQGGSWQIVGYEWIWDEETQQYIEVPIWGWVPSNTWTKHYAFYGHNYDTIKDYVIFSYTGWPYSKQHFSFIWTCASADLMLHPITSELCYGYIDTQNGTGEVGMPLAWTSRFDLSFYGYTDPDASNYCYIGFENTSKPLKEQVDGTGYTYSWFIYYFYDHAIGWGPGCTHHTIKESLNYASQQIWGVPYGQCMLYTGYWDNYSRPGYSFYCRMRVFGNSNIFLPY